MTAYAVMVISRRFKGARTYIYILCITAAQSWLLCVSISKTIETVNMQIAHPVGNHPCTEVNSLQSIVHYIPVQCHKRPIPRPCNSSALKEGGGPNITWAYTAYITVV